MILVDVNLLIYAVFADSLRHDPARVWLDATLGGLEPVALPWAVLTGFARVATNPRVMTHPLTMDEAIGYLEEWLALSVVRVIEPSRGHLGELSRMLRGAKGKGNLVSDAHLAALAIEHDCTLASTDDDFRRFPDLRWFNPLLPRPPGV